jgi:osmotically-inducible protein OsmY
VTHSTRILALPKIVATALLMVGAIQLTGCAPAVLGGSGGGLVAEDRRTTGVYIEDEAIEWRGMRALNDRIQSENWHINVTSFNRRVLLTGEVENEQMKIDAENAVRTAKEVKDVVNELAIKDPSRVYRRGNDTAITGAVKSRFIGNSKFSPIHVKVVTEANVVYLMGIVTQAEADAAVEIARTTRGVSKVVRVFEYR